MCPLLPDGSNRAAGWDGGIQRRAGTAVAPDFGCCHGGCGIVIRPLALYCWWAVLRRETFVATVVLAISGDIKEFSYFFGRI
jgi:hypothetical protein